MNIDFHDAIIIALVGLATGIINTFAGGGSLITLPVMIFMGLPPHVANATNRVAIFAQNIFSVAGFHSKGVSAFSYSIWLGLSAFVGAAIGAKFAVDISGQMFNRILSVVMLVVVIATVFQPRHQDGKAEKLEFKNKALGFVAFFVIGIYGGFLQAGVGLIMIASLTTINGFSLVKTNSIKVLVTLIYTLAALGIFIYEDAINWSYGLFLGAGNAAGGWFASRWSVEKGDKWIRLILILSVAAMSIKLWFF